MKTIINAFKHTKRILRHKYFVFKYCCKLGIPWQGITHDLSKFSPTEFIESIKYYQEGISPIDVAKKEKGYANAWFHHKGQNPHHCEYWTDHYGTKPSAVQMPDKYVRELIADYIGAAKAYFGEENFTYKNEIEWWNKKKETLLLHPKTEELIDYIFYILDREEKRENTVFNMLRTVYKNDIYRILEDNKILIEIKY